MSHGTGGPSLHFLSGGGGGEVAVPKPGGLWPLTLAMPPRGWLGATAELLFQWGGAQHAGAREARGGCGSGRAAQGRRFSAALGKLKVWGHDGFFKSRPELDPNGGLSLRA